MSDRTAIEWTDASWNTAHGCTKVSIGCKNCYAEAQMKRFEPELDFRFHLRPNAMGLPRTWKSSRMVFVNSMSDLFHQDAPDDYIREVFRVMLECPRHTFQVLTKRPERAVTMSWSLPWPPNVWMGVSVETSDYYERLDALRSIPAALRFVSFEPLLGPLEDPPLDGIGWAIVGGESGRNARPIEASWVQTIRDRCQSAGIPFFFKQWGGLDKKTAGCSLDGQEWKEWPKIALTELKIEQLSFLQPLAVR